MQLQWYDEAALVRAGKIVHVLSCAGSQGVVPQLEHVHPMALHTGAPEQLLLTGTNLAILNNRVHVRCLGKLPRSGGCALQSASTSRPGRPDKHPKSSCDAWSAVYEEATSLLC